MAEHLLANYTRIDRDGARRALTPSLCSAQTVAVRRGGYRNQLQRGLPVPTVHRIPSTGNLLITEVLIRARPCQRGSELVGVEDREAPARRQHLFRGRRVKIRDLVDAGLLEAGAILVWDLPQAGETYQVTVAETGQLQLPDGGQAGSPSRAIKDLTGKSVDGWYAWRTADKGRSIDDLRQQLLQQVVRDGSNAGAAELEARQDEFLDSALKAAESGSPRQVTVRELIGIWGSRVRDFGVNERVNADLNNRGLTTRPDFRAVTLDDTVSVTLTTQISRDGPPVVIADEPSEALEVAQVTITADDDEVAWDHGLTIGNLPSASKVVSSVAPDATFEQAITVMII